MYSFSFLSLLVSDGQIVPSHYCTAANVVRPESELSCSSRSCIWLVSSSAQCNRECNGLLLRNVSCVNEFGAMQLEQNCFESKPISELPCNINQCGNCTNTQIHIAARIFISIHSLSLSLSLLSIYLFIYLWMLVLVYSDWSSCSSVCNSGFASRSRICKSFNNSIIPIQFCFPANYSDDHSPQINQTCNTQSCCTQQSSTICSCLQSIIHYFHISLAFCSVVSMVFLCLEQL